MEDNKIIFNKDIAKKVAEELKVDEKMVLYHIDFIVHRIKTLAKVPSVLNIQLPHLGLLHWKWTEPRRIWERLKEKGTLEDRGERWSGMYDRFKDRMEYLYKNDFFEKGNYSRHHKGIKIYKYFFNKKMSLKQLEEWQNKEE